MFSLIIFCSYDFQNLKYLDVLNISNNALLYIHLDAFRDLSGLRMVDISNNSLSLENLIYRKNKSNSLFYYCQTLEYLSLAYNNISSLKNEFIRSAYITDSTLYKPPHLVSLLLLIYKFQKVLIYNFYKK